MSFGGFITQCQGLFCVGQVCLVAGDLDRRKLLLELGDKLIDGGLVRRVGKSQVYTIRGQFASTCTANSAALLSSE